VDRKEIFWPATPYSDTGAPAAPGYVEPHSSDFQQSCFLEHCQKVLLHLGKRLSNNPSPGNQDQVDGLDQFVLVKAEAFSQETAGAVARDRVANPAGGNDPEPRSRLGGQGTPIGHQAGPGQPAAFLPRADKIPPLFDPRLSTEP
jgi:hypothetical protein